MFVKNDGKLGSNSNEDASIIKIGINFFTQLLEIPRVACFCHNYNFQNLNVRASRLKLTKNLYAIIVVFSHYKVVVVDTHINVCYFWQTFA